MANIGGASGSQSEWLLPARLMRSPPTVVEQAALAAGRHITPTDNSFSKARIAFGTAAVAVAVAAPSISLEAMVVTIGEASFGAFPGIGTTETDAEEVKPSQLASSTPVWTPAPQPAGPVYARALLEEGTDSTVSSQTRFGDFDRELPLAVLDGGSETFDLAFAGVAMPTPLTAVVSGGLRDGPTPLTQTRRAAIATGTLEIEQITDLDLVVRATPENVRGPGQIPASGSSSSRTDAIASRSVEAAFAGAIDASNAVRSSLPIAPSAESGSPQPSADEIRRAIPVGAISPEVSATAAAEAVLVPKAKLDARVNGVHTGSVDFRQFDGTIAIRLRSVANLMREQFSKTEFARLTQGQSIDTYVPLAQLQAAGIPVNYNPAYDEVEFGIDYQDAPNAKKVQVDQISVPSLSSELVAIEQIPR
ncbi:hypothetical protein [uncultured Erythrobacter sp.]|uniref:hypothetical protein n=1 Tax=uncultured Erythrobacter sp. TaxID=263913 RepID=UPI00262BEADD|nr:hypothetical protein [uncultured Erythrobacter sp.]